MKFDNITAVIPVRERYDDVVDNSLLSFGDVTLLEWKIIQLKRILPPDRIVLSTNSKRAMDFAKPYDIGIVKREERCCREDTPFSETVKGMMNPIEATDIAVCPCTAPFLGPKTYGAAFAKYNDNLAKKTHYSLATVNEMREYVWDKNKPLNYTCGEGFQRESELPLWYRVTNGLFMMSKKRMLSRGYFLDDKPYLFGVDILSGMDIKYFGEYEITKELLSYYLGREVEREAP